MPNISALNISDPAAVQEVLDALVATQACASPSPSPLPPLSPSPLRPAPALWLTLAKTRNSANI